jgi:hypothetical protein
MLVLLLGVMHNYVTAMSSPGFTRFYKFKEEKETETEKDQDWIKASS